MKESDKIIELREQVKVLGLRTGRNRNRYPPNSKKKKKNKRKKQPPPPPRKPKISYEQLLKSKEWRAKRLEILKRDNYTCQNCGSKEILHVHHLKYVGKPWECPDQFLITLCESCHKEVHKTNLPTSPIFVKKRYGRYPPQCSDCPVQ